LVDLRRDVAKRAKDCEALRRDIQSMHKHLQSLEESKKECVALNTFIAGQRSRITELRTELHRKQTAVKQQMDAGYPSTTPSSSNARPSQSDNVKTLGSLGRSQQRRSAPPRSARSARSHSPQNSHARREAAAENGSRPVGAGCGDSTAGKASHPQKPSINSWSQIDGSSLDSSQKPRRPRPSQRKKPESCSRHCLIAPIGEQLTSDFAQCSRFAPPPPPVKPTRPRAHETVEPMNNGHARRPHAASWDSLRPSSRTPRATLGKAVPADASPKSTAESPKSAGMMGSWSPPPSPAKSGASRIYIDMEDIDSDGLEPASESNGDSPDVTHPVLGRMMEELDHQTRLLNTVFGPVPQKLLRRSRIQQASTLRSNSESDLPALRKHASFDGVPRRSKSPSARSHANVSVPLEFSP